MALLPDVEVHLVGDSRKAAKASAESSERMTGRPGGRVSRLGSGPEASGTAAQRSKRPVSRKPALAYIETTPV